MNLGKAANFALKTVPDPDCDIFQRRRADPVHFVEELVVERAANVRDGRREVVEVKHESCLHVGLALDGDAHMEGMAVNSRIRVSRSGRRQEVRGFECKLFIDLHRSQSSSDAAVRRSKP